MASREHFLSLFQTNLSDKPFINYFSTEERGFSITFGEFQALTNQIDGLLSKSLSGNFEFVGIQLKDYLWLPCLLASIWKLGKACACIGTQYSHDCNLNFLNALHVKYLISDTGNPCRLAALMETFQINSRRFYVWKMELDSVSNISNKPLDICYGIMTSGSTGSPKIIQVPWSCILPNVYELVHMFSVNENDNVYLSSPYTCDPFFVELFMPFITSCTLTIVSPELKLSPETLLRILFENHVYTWNEVNTGLVCKTGKILQPQVTIMQMTPSIFKRWSLCKIKDVVLSKKSALRILLLGGEKFPTDLLQHKSKGNKTKICNIYGITEISCWAFVNTNADNENDISLGCPLNDIVYKIDDNHELVLGSRKRRCLIDDEKNFEIDDIVFRKTGDIVMVKSSQIHYVSRSNQIVKKFGIKVNLEKIENLFLTCHKNIKECFCVFDESTMKLALYYTNDELNANYHVVTGQEMIVGLVLNSNEIPDYIIEIPKAPLNSNGKCDKRGLLLLLKEIIRKRKIENDVEVVFKRIWMEIIGEKNFVTGGGDSVKALQMVTKLEESGVEVTGDFLPQLLTHGEYDKCLSRLKMRLKEEKKMKMERNYKFEMLWRFDMTKCVDAPPVIFERNGDADAVVGSHSSRLSSVKVDTGQHNWTINLTDRIESGFSVNKSSTYGVIGCYDQHVYSISTSDGGIIWKYRTGGMVKSTPCFSSDEETVYAASYDGFLYCLKSQDGKLVARLKISDRGVFSSCVISKEVEAVFIATLDGCAISVNQKTNEINWKHNLGNPIFSSPVVVRDTVIFTQVTGQLECFHARTGNKVWQFDCNGCVYSTPVWCPSLNSIAFPCYDNHLYCLQVSEKATIKWRIQLDSPGFAKPCVFSKDDTWLISVTTIKGFIYLFELESGSNLAQIKLDGELFSSPKVYNDIMVIGCRDNYLYCIKIVVSKDE